MSKTFFKKNMQMKLQNADEDQRLHVLCYAVALTCFPVCKQSKATCLETRGEPHLPAEEPSESQATQQNSGHLQQQVTLMQLSRC